MLLEEPQVIHNGNRKVNLKFHSAKEHTWLHTSSVRAAQKRKHCRGIPVIYPRGSDRWQFTQHSSFAQERDKT